MQHIHVEDSSRGFITAKRLETAFDIEERKGLSRDTDRFELLRLVKRAGKQIGFTPRMTALLEQYIMLTFDQDWKQGKRPVVYQSLAKTAFALGVSERQIQKLETSLADIGAITWNHSSNYKRYGYRDSETKDIVEAYGVDLSPLLDLAPLLERAFKREEERQQEWFTLKKQISFYRGNIRKLLAGLSHVGKGDLRHGLEEQYTSIAGHIRTYMSNIDLKSLLEAHKCFYNDVMGFYEDDTQKKKTSSFLSNYTPLDELLDVHIQYTTQKISNKLDSSSLKDTAFQKEVVKSRNPDGTDQQTETSVEENIANITWKQVLNASSERFRDKLPYDSTPLSWDAIVNAAYALLPTLGINKSAWWDACEVLGRYGAAIAIIIIDEKSQSDDLDQRVYRPGGYLRAMVKRAKEGKLNLHKSVFGLLKRDETRHDA